MDKDISEVGVWDISLTDIFSMKYGRKFEINYKHSLSMKNTFYIHEKYSLSVKCRSFLWNVFSMKCSVHEMSMKCQIYNIVTINQDPAKATSPQITRK